MQPGKDADFDEAVRGALLAHTCPLSFWDIVRRDDHEGAVLPALSLASRAAPWALLGLALLGAWLYVGRLEAARDSAIAGQAATAQALRVETLAREAVTAAYVRAEQTLVERERVRKAQAHELSRLRGQLQHDLETPDAQPWAVVPVPARVLARLRAAAAGDDGRAADTTGEPARAD